MFSKERTEALNKNYTQQEGREHSSLKKRGISVNILTWTWAAVFLFTLVGLFVVEE